jgi:hypothetical protein
MPNGVDNICAMPSFMRKKMRRNGMQGSKHRRLTDRS